MLQESQTETQETKAFWEVIFISMLAGAQQIHIQMLSPENKGISPRYPCKQVTKTKS
jgi:hypothetical protein